MGSLRPSRSDAEIRQGSFSPCLVVGRPKSGKSRLVCFSRAAGLSARLGATSRRCGLWSCPTTRRLPTAARRMAVVLVRLRQRERAGWATTKWLLPPKLDSNGGRERISQYQPRAHHSGNRGSCAGFGLITRYLSGSLARSTCSDRRNCRGNANAVQARMDPCRWRQ